MKLTTSTKFCSKDTITLQWISDKSVKSWDGKKNVKFPCDTNSSVYYYYCFYFLGEARGHLILAVDEIVWSPGVRHQESTVQVIIITKMRTLIMINNNNNNSRVYKRRPFVKLFPCNSHLKIICLQAWIIKNTCPKSNSIKFKFNEIKFFV